MKTLDEHRIQGLDAQSLKDNPALKKIFADFRAEIDKREESVHFEDTKAIERLILTRQVLREFERLIDRYITDGQLAQMELDKMFKPAAQKVKQFRR